MKKIKGKCGCGMLIYEDCSKEPEIAYCHLHKAAPKLLELLRLCEAALSHMGDVKPSEAITAAREAIKDAEKA